MTLMTMSQTQAESAEFIIPDPLKAVPVSKGGDWCVSQRQRRAQILANARIALHDCGFAGVSVREVARKSSVSTQTVYNLVGSKVLLLAQAVIEHIAIHGEIGLTRTGYPNSILALTDTHWESATRFPNYTRQAVFACFLPGRPLYSHVKRKAMALVVAGLHRMAREDLLKSTDYDGIGARLVAVHGISAYNGFTETEGFTPFRRQMVVSTAHILLPVVTASHAAEIERWLRDFDQTDRPEAADLPGLRLC